MEENFDKCNTLALFAQVRNNALMLKGEAI